MNHGEETVEAPVDARHFVDFPEDKIVGDGFTQLNPKTGWLWVGINLNKFNFRDAWAFIKSQEFAISQYLSQREQQAMVRAQLASAAPKEKHGIAAMAKRLGIKI